MLLHVLAQWRGVFAITTATSRLPCYCQGGDRGEHASKGSGDVVDGARC